MFGNSNKNNNDATAPQKVATLLPLHFFGDFWPCTRFPLPIPFAHHQQHRSIVFVYFARITALQSEFVGKQLHIHTATVVTRKH